MKKETAAERPHALLSCSGAHRWMNCPGSVKMSEGFPDKGSIYADEGTLAHEAGECLIETGEIPQELIDRIEKFYAEHLELEYSTQEMLEDVRIYADFVNREYTKEREVDPEPMLRTEMRVDLTRWIPDGFGTSDIVIARWGKLHIIDLKYGKGVKVSAVDNPQLRLYALGALAALDEEYRINDVQMTIYQPRTGNISEDFITADDLYSWGSNVVGPAAKLTEDDDAPVVPGEWCTFCPAKKVCKGRAEKYMSVTKYMEKNTLSAGEIAEILHQIDGLTAWVNDLKEGAIERIQSGDTLPGWKVVEGQSRRKYTVKDKDIIDTCISAGFPLEKVSSVKVKTITEMEKFMGKDKFAEVLGALVDKPAGKPTLAKDDEWK